MSAAEPAGAGSWPAPRAWCALGGTIDADAYLARLGVPPGPASLGRLFAIHRAQVERIAYTSLDFHLAIVRGSGFTPGIDEYESAARVAAGGRAGYCYHLNGALAALLRAQSYDVRRHVAGVHLRGHAEPPGPNGNHLALTVAGLPAPAAADGVWLVDAGLGDALHEPLPLVAGEYRQGPFTYRLRPSEVAPGGWRFDHDASGGFVGMDFGLAPAAMTDFTDNHAQLSRSPQSPFVQLVVAQRRDATGVDALRGRVLRRIGAGGYEREIADETEFYAVLAATFGLALDDVDAAARAALWRRVRVTHAAWLRQSTAAGAPLSHADSSGALA